MVTGKEKIAEKDEKDEMVMAGNERWKESVRRKIKECKGSVGCMEGKEKVIYYHGDGV